MGKTRRGKGSKLLVLSRGQGLPLASHTASAAPAEVTLAERVLQEVAAQPPKDCTPLIADRVCDSDALRDRLRESG